MKPVWDVTGYDIVLTHLWNQEVSFVRPESASLAREARSPDLTGEFCRADGQTFVAEVRWSCPGAWSEGKGELKGVLALLFRHNGKLPPPGVGYYSQVNAPILAFPYIRELVAHLTAGIEGGPIVLPPLDVPKFVKEATASWANRLLKIAKRETPETGTGNDGAPPTDGSAL